MQTVSSVFTAEERDSVRKIAYSSLVSWKKDYLPSIRFFTIGVSSIGGNDIIPGPSGVNSAWNYYKYVDETDYITSISYERELNTPLGGMVRAQADLELDNTSGRFTPRYAGGVSDISTAIEPRRPMIISAGFNNLTVPQFVGLTDRQVKIDKRNGDARMHGVDFISFLQNKLIDRTEMFTSQRSDVSIENALVSMGLSTAQYELDEGINTIGFGLFETGQKLGNYLDEIVQAEQGHLFQDEEGKIRFWNRQHFDTSPYNEVQRIISTAQVLNAKTLGDSEIINVVEVVASPRDVLDSEKLVGIGNGYGLGITELPVGDTIIWINYDDPVFQVTAPVPNGTSGQTSYFVANTEQDDTGTDVTSSVSLAKIENFAQASKLTFTNGSGATAYLTTLDVWGRPARKTGDIYYRDKNGNSVTAYEEQILKVENNYIQSSSWAASYATLILQDFALPGKWQGITIRAIPELQMGDLISWQGRYNRVYGISTRLDSSEGFVQDLKIVQRDTHDYFKIGISTIGGQSEIAP